MSGTLMPAPWFTGLNTDGNPVSAGLLWTYNAGTNDEVLTYQDSALLVPHANPVVLDAAGRAVVYLAPGSSYKVRLEAAATPPAHGALIKEQDNVGATPGSASAVDMLLVAGEAFLGGEAGYVSDGSGGLTAGRVYKADADLAYASATPTVVFATGPVAAGDIASFRDEGTLPTSGLVVGATYYLTAAAGVIGTTAGSNSRRVGQAKSATELLLTPNPPVPTVNYLTATNILANRSFG